MRPPRYLRRIRRLVKPHRSIPDPIRFEIKTWDVPARFSELALPSVINYKPLTAKVKKKLTGYFFTL